MINFHFDASYVSLPSIFYSFVKPTPVQSPRLLKLNKTLAQELGLNEKLVQTDESVAIFAGNLIPPNADPIAQAYAGHQFGHFTMLGDGRAILLGEHITPDKKRVDIQLKGAGRTPYSRGGDGRAALGPMLREYIISEAMHALRIPTSRSLAVVSTGEPVFRETEFAGAILTRIASSHLRVGTFQYAANWGEISELKQLADYTIKRHYPIEDKEENPYLALLRAVIDRQAELIAKWQLVGFIHGVMNTDNMTISGETIDYGPCAFMDAYDVKTVFSSIDYEGRYAYGNQPYIGGWNLTRFAETLIPLLHEDEKRAIELAQGALSEYAVLFERYWLQGWRAKLGIYNEEADDKNLIKDLLEIMQNMRADFTNTLLSLTFGEMDEGLTNSKAFVSWHKRWEQRISRQNKSSAEITELMKNNNPAVIPRNHRVEEALEAAVNEGDYCVMDKLLAVLRNPFAHLDDQKEYAQPAKPSKIPYRTFCGT
ncbi:protein adenylyltransferase SelO [Bacillus kwashiorkori]|uniref:protein adenylyltransferase SelO n=1 Tax=Bacillus kwashiorkori TaxID=1522318 RepID=UPI00078543E3|nr:YdiU family protein [Bacillus kwashiorkori]